MRHSILTPDQTRELGQAVRKLEDRTAAELVVVIRPASAGYWLPLLVPGLLSLVVFTGLMGVPQEFTVRTIVWVSWLAGFGLAVPLALLPKLRLGCYPRSFRRAAAEEAAHAAFSRHRVCDTRDREGILLYCSILEGETVILFDGGIRRVLEDPGLAALPQECLEKARTGGFPSGMLAAIDHLGRELGRVSPPSEFRVNELDDAPILEAADSPVSPP